MKQVHEFVRSKTNISGSNKSCNSIKNSVENDITTGLGGLVTGIDDQQIEEMSIRKLRLEDEWSMYRIMKE